MADKHDPRSPGEAIGYPLQYSWTFLVAQMVKNPSAMQETWVQSLLGWEDHLEGRHGNPLQYSWTFLVAQIVNNLPAMQEAWV